MNAIITDGKSGFTAGVDKSNRLKTFSVTQSENTSASVDGNTYFITHDIINLTSTTVSFAFHVANTDTEIWIVTQFQQFFGVSTGGSGDFKTSFVKNPTGGTLLSAGTAAVANNMNLGSSKTLTGTFLKGVEGSTSSGGVALPLGIVPTQPTQRSFTGGPIIIPPGTSFSFGVTPPTGNTSMNVKFNLIIHRDVTGE